MPEKIIAGTLKIDTGTTVTDVGNVNKELNKTSKELGQANEEGKETTGSFTNLKTALGQVPGPLGAVNQGVNTVNTSLKALAANPIVLVITLLVAALVAVYKAFASTEAGAEKLEQIFSGLGAIVTVIRDRILALAGAVISFFKGDFKEAIDKTKAAVSGVGDAIVEAYGRAAAATRDLQAAQDDLERRIDVNRAKLNKDFADIKELISDNTASYKARKAAVEAYGAAQEKQAADEIANAKELERIAQDNADRDKQNSQYQTDLAKATIARVNAEAQAASDRRAINKADKQIEADQLQKSKEAADKQKQINDDASKAAQQRADNELAQKQKNFDAQLQFNKGLKQVADAEKEAQKEQDAKDQKERDDYQKKIDDEQIAGIDKVMKKSKEATDEEIKNDKLRLQAKQSFTDSMSSLLKSASDLFGKSTAAGKILAIAGATIDTFRGAQAAFTGMVTTFPGPWGIAAGIAAAAAAVAGGIKNIKEIAKVKVPGGGGGGEGNISAPSMTAPQAPIAPRQQGTTIDQSSIQGIGDATSGRAWVVSQDITHDQDRDERLNRAARLGG